MFENTVQCRLYRPLALSLTMSHHTQRVREHGTVPALSPPSLPVSLPHVTTQLVAGLAEGSPKKTIVREGAVGLKILRSSSTYFKSDILKFS